MSGPNWPLRLSIASPKMCNGKGGGLRKAPSYSIRRGFSLVELVTAIAIMAILAVAVFSGGASAIKKAKLSRVTSDLYDFTLATEQFLRATPSVANDQSTQNFISDTSRYVVELNGLLPQGYRLSSVDDGAITDVESGGNISFHVADTAVAYVSEKVDAWGNPYFVLLDYDDRHGQGKSDFFITIISAGPDALLDVGGGIGEDDVFSLCQYSNGEVTSKTYNATQDPIAVVNATLPGGVEYITSASGSYSGREFYRPVTDPATREGGGDYGEGDISGGGSDTGAAEGVTQLPGLSSNGRNVSLNTGIVLRATDSITISFHINSLPAEGSAGAPILYCGALGNMPYIDSTGKVMCNRFDSDSKPIILSPGVEYTMTVSPSMLSCGAEYQSNNGTPFIGDILYLFGYGYNYADIFISGVVVEHASGLRDILVPALKDGANCMYNKTSGIAFYPSPSDGTIAALS